MMDDDPFAGLLELRLRLRGNPQGRALVDRCLSLVTRALEAGPSDLAGLDAEIESIRDELALRFGAPKSARTQ